MGSLIPVFHWREFEGQCSRCYRGSHMLSCTYLYMPPSRHRSVSGYSWPSFSSRAWRFLTDPDGTDFFGLSSRSVANRYDASCQHLKSKFFDSCHEVSHWTSTDAVNSQSRILSYLVTATSAGSMAKAMMLIPPPN